MSYAAASKSIPQYHTSQEPGASWSFGGVPFATIQKNPQLLFPAGDRWWTRQFLLFPLATCSTCYVQSVEDQKYFNTCVEEMMDLLDKVNSPWLHFPKSGLNVVKLMEQKRKAYRMHLEEMRQQLRAGHCLDYSMGAEFILPVSALLGLVDADLLWLANLANPSKDIRTGSHATLDLNGIPLEHH